MMARIRVFLGVSLACVLVAWPLMAAEEGAGRGQRGQRGQGQPRGAMGMRGGFGMFGQSKLQLCGIEQVQTELKITEEQKTKITEIQTGLRGSGGGMRGMRDMSQEEREKLMAERQKARDDAEKKLEELLKPEQAKRLGQIQVQLMGVQALKDEKIAKELKITEEQTKKIDEAIAWGQEENSKLFEEMRAQGGQGGGRGSEAFAQMREKMQKIQTDVQAKAVAALSKEQQEQLAKMKGDAFELDMSAMRGPGAFGGRGTRGGQQGAPPGGAGGGRQRQRPESET